MRLLSLLLMALALSACAGATGTHGSRDPGMRSDILTAAEMAPINGSVLDAIRALRPRYLRAKPTHEPVIYVDGVRVESANRLDLLRVSDVADVRFLRGIDATTGYGTGHAAGAILVRTRRGWTGGP